ncbi:regulatory-associated protein of mTOR-like, partial [Rhincodon typus]|uniref:regulatory-associated protein of mTOR-like n=1 Tax=Rhincodon typus TaxID=259920 RepID=UPI00202FF193
GSPPIPSTSSSSLTNDVSKQTGPRDISAVPRPGTGATGGSQYTPHSHQFSRTRKMFDKGPDQTVEDSEDGVGHKSFMSTTMQTGFCDWSAKYFAQPVMKPGKLILQALVQGQFGMFNKHCLRDQNSYPLKE